MEFFQVNEWVFSIILVFIVIVFTIELVYRIKKLLKERF